jgi:predicted O-methyltransferase YrrM
MLENAAAFQWVGVENQGRGCEAVNKTKSFLRARLNPTVYSALSKTKQALWHSGNTSEPAQTDLGKLAEIGEPFSSVLRSMYSGQPQKGLDGQDHELRLHTRISVEEGACLYRLCRDTKAERTMEIGCAYGFSTLYFLAAISANPAATHTAIDPFESKGWAGIAVQNARAVGMGKSFRLIEENSFLAVPRMISDGTQYDVIFIDGNHRFDDTLVEFTLCGLTCKMGGYILLDDMWMPSIRKAVSFVRRNRRDFSEVTMPVLNLAAFQRVAEDKRDWDHFEDFQ